MNTPSDKLRRGQSGSPIVVRFQLTANLTAGSSAAAVILEFGGVPIPGFASTGQVITVHSAIGGFEGVIGDRGVALYWPDANRFETLPVSEGLTLTPFSLNGTMGPTLPGVVASAPAIVIEWDAGLVDWTVTGSAITVWDVPHFSNPNGASTNTRGWAVFNDVNARYEIVSLDIDPEALQLEPFVLDSGANLALNGSAAAHLQVWGGAAWAAGPTAVTVFDLAGFGPAVPFDEGWAMFRPTSGRWEIVSLKPAATVLRWAIALSNWTAGALNTSKVSCHEATGKDGIDAGGAAFDVFLPVAATSCAPNVRTGNIIGYMFDAAGLRTAVTGYLDDALGMIKIWAGAAAAIGQGWQLCDGTNGTPDLREKFVLGASGDAGGDSDFDGEGGNTFVGETGGLKRKLVNWEHTNFGSPLLRTFNTEQQIFQPQSFYTEKEDPPLTVSGAGAFTDYATSDVEVITERGAAGSMNPNLHYDHVHTYNTLDVEITEVGLIYQVLGNNPTCADTDLQGTEAQVIDGSDTLDVDCTYFQMAHYIVEPGESQDLYDHPTVPPDAKTGHRHPLGDDILFTLHWGTGTYDGHYHQVIAGTLDGKLAIRDVTHNSPAGVAINWHYHDYFLDNHQEFINRIPPYYALCYIMRVS